MARPAALLTLALGLATLVAPAGAAARCWPTPDGPPLTARIGYAGDDRSTHHRTRVVTCDRRRGRRRVLRRARYDVRRRTGRAFASVSAAGGRVAWVEGRFARGTGAILVTVADGRSGRVLRRVPVAQPAAFELLGNVAAVITTRGELAWTIGAGDGLAQVVYDHPRAPARVLARGAVGSLRLQDDTTLLWRDELGLASFDVPTVDLGAGCPKRRSRYRFEVELGGVVFTRRTFSDVGGEGSTLRACDRRTGIDAVVGSDGVDYGFGGTSVVALGGGNGWVVLRETESNRYDMCGTYVLSTVEIATRRRGRRFLQAGCRVEEVSRPVVTVRGVPAWLAGEGFDRRLLVAGEASDHEPEELDRGAIGNLRAEGEEVVWTRDGEERRARP